MHAVHLMSDATCMSLQDASHHIHFRARMIMQNKKISLWRCLLLTTTPCYGSLNLGSRRLLRVNFTHKIYSAELPRLYPNRRNDEVQ